MTKDFLNARVPSVDLFKQHDYWQRFFNFCLSFFTLCPSAVIGKSETVLSFILKKCVLVQNVFHSHIL